MKITQYFPKDTKEAAAMQYFLEKYGMSYTNGLTMLTKRNCIMVEDTSIFGWKTTKFNEFFKPNRLDYIHIPYYEIEMEL